MPGAARLPRGEHARRDGRLPLAAVRSGSAGRRPGWTTSSNLVPARLTGLLTVALRRPRRRLAAARLAGAGAATAPATRARTPAGARRPSPARSASGSAARNVYGGRAEHRPELGDGPPPQVARRPPRRPPRPARSGWAAARPRGRRRARDRRREPPVRGALLVAGTTSDAGKSVVTAGLCRWLARAGRVGRAVQGAEHVATTRSSRADGAEIGRAQVMQARGGRRRARGGDEPGAAQAGQRPTSARSSCSAGPSPTCRRARLRRPAAARCAEPVLDALADLRRRFDVVICEGAGSPAEINLRARRHRQHGPGPRRRTCRWSSSATSTAAACSPPSSARSRCCSPEDQALVAASSSTSSAATRRCSRPGLDLLTAAHRPAGARRAAVARPGLWLDAEDSLASSAAAAEPGAAAPATDVLRVAVAAAAADVQRHRPRRAGRRARRRRALRAPRPDEIADADLVVLPGTRATVDRPGLAARARARRRGASRTRRRRARRCSASAAATRCSAARSTTTSRPRRRDVPGLGLLPASVRRSRPEKTLARPVGRGARRAGRGLRDPPRRSSRSTADAEPFLDGCRAGAVWGTTWHGALENDGFRRAFLREVAARPGATGSCRPRTPRSRPLREARLDVLGDVVEEHLDTDAIAAADRVGRHTGPAVRAAGGALESRP